MSIEIKGFGGLVVYLGIGFLVYMLIYVPDVFTWGDPWLYIVAALWPFALAWEFLVIIFWIAVAIAAICFVCYVYDRCRSW